MFTTSRTVLVSMILIMASGFSGSRARADTGPLWEFGRPQGLSDASQETLAQAKIPTAYGFVVGDEGESNEVWVLETDVGFEKAVAEVSSWMDKNGLSITDSECSSQTNQQCEIIAEKKGVVKLVVYVADEGRQNSKRMVMIRAEGPASRPN